MENRVADGLNIKNSKLVEFLQERQTIVQYIQSGHLPKIIWRALREAGRLSMSYVWFMRLIQRYIPMPPTPHLPGAPQVAPQSQQPRRGEPLMPWREEKPKRV